jgi:hypothetical protein
MHLNTSVLLLQYFLLIIFGVSFFGILGTMAVELEPEGGTSRTPLKVYGEGETLP